MTYSNEAIRTAAFSFYAELKSQNGNFNPKYAMDIVLVHYDGQPGEGMQFYDDVKKFISDKMGKIVYYASGMGIVV